MTLGESSTAKRIIPSHGRKHQTPVTYSSRIIKAGALLGDTKTFLLHWDTNASVAENTDRIRRDNLFGKASRSRVGDILAIFRQRYLAEECVTKALVLLVHQKFPAPAMDRVLYYHSARADQLLHDAVTEILMPMYKQGLVDINVEEFQRLLAKLILGKTIRPWSETTLLRAARSILATLRDFGILRGAVNKKIAPQFLPIESFAHIVFYLKQHQPSGAKLLELPDWKLFFLSREDVERFLFEAHQRRLLEYHVAGNVTRLTFPVNTLEAYANVLAQR